MSGVMKPVSYDVGGGGGAVRTVSYDVAYMNK